MRILVTGGSGFIGRNLTEQLRGRHTVYAPPRAELNLTDQESVDRWFSSHAVDVVVHTAIKPGHRNAKDPTGLLDADLRMFFNLCRHVESDPSIRLFNVGSGCCYDMRHYQPDMTEDYFGTHVPTDDTGFAKYVISSCCLRSFNLYDLRVFGIFGKYEDYAIRFISNAICKTLAGIPVTLRQDRMFSYVWIDDFVSILESLFEADIPVHAINVTPDRAVSLLSLARMVTNIAGNDDHPILVSSEGMGMEYSGNNRLLRSILPDLRFTPIEKAVKNLYKWYVKNQDSIDRAFLATDK